MMRSARKWHATLFKPSILLRNLPAIKMAKAILAAIIARDGPELLPLFLRLEAEETTAGTNAAALDRALSLASAIRPA